MEINIVPKFLDNALTPVAKEAGETLGDLINLARSPLIKARKIRDLKMDIFLKDLERELQAIPEEKIVEPPLSIVGPALEELFKYYMEEEHIVEFFRRLISDSMNMDKQEKVLPSYFGVIKQMTCFDAIIYKKLVENKYNEVFTGFITIKNPKDGNIIKYHIAFWNDCIKELNTNIECENDKWDIDFAQKSILSLHTLKVLGLINTYKMEYKDRDWDIEQQGKGYVYDRFEDILYDYREIYNLDFRLSRKRVIVYFLTDYGKNLGKLLI